MIKVIEKATGAEFSAKHIEGGFEVYKGLELYKKIKESTFKKYFRVTGEAAEAEKKPEESKATESQEAKKSVKAKDVKPQEAHEELDPEKRENMIEKIKKVLKLAEENPSMEEGLSAALQAQKLMTKYNIHEDEVTLEEVKDDICSVFTHQKHNSHLLAWRKVLGSIVARNFRCKCYVHGQDVVFRGYKKDADIAVQVYLTLYTIGNQLGTKAYDKQKLETGTGKGAYNSFVTGFLAGVDEGLEAQCTALMIITPKEVEEEFAQFSAGFKSAKSSLRVTDGDLYHQGKIEGKNAVKARAIEEK